MTRNEIIEGLRDIRWGKGVDSVTLETIRQAIELLTPQEPRLLSAEELAGMPFGHGWEESRTMLEDDEGNSTIECKEVHRVAWADGLFAYKDSYTDIERILKNYNRRGCGRIWLGEDPPSKAQRDEAPWRHDGPVGEHFQERHEGGKAGDHEAAAAGSAGARGGCD